MTEHVLAPKGRNKNRITGGFLSMDMPYEFKDMAIITTPDSQYITTAGWSVDVRNTPDPVSLGKRPGWSVMPMFAPDDDGQPSMDIHVYLPFKPGVRQFLEALKEPLRNGEAQIDLWILVPMLAPTPDDERTMVLQNYRYQPGPQSELDDAEWRLQATQSAPEDAGIATARVRIRCAPPVTCHKIHAPPKDWGTGKMGELPEAVRDYYNLNDTKD